MMVISELWSNLTARTMPRVWVINQSKHGCKLNGSGFLIRVFNSHYRIEPGTSDRSWTITPTSIPWLRALCCRASCDIWDKLCCAMWQSLPPTFSGQLTVALSFSHMTSSLLFLPLTIISQLVHTEHGFSEAHQHHSSHASSFSEIPSSPPLVHQACWLYKIILQNCNFPRATSYCILHLLHMKHHEHLTRKNWVFLTHIFYQF